MLLHLRAIVERQVAHVDGTSHFRQGHKLGEVVLILRLLRHTKENCEFFKLLKSNSLQKRTSRNSEYLTYQVVEVVGTTCCILEEGGIRIYIAIQQTIKDLKSDDWNWNEKASMTCVPSTIRKYCKCRWRTTSTHYLKSLHPLLLLDELNSKVCLLVDVLLLEFIYHSRLVQELTVATQHLMWTNSKISLYCHLSASAYRSRRHQTWAKWRTKVQCGQWKQKTQ